MFDGNRLEVEGLGLEGDIEVVNYLFFVAVRLGRILMKNGFDYSVWSLVAFGINI